ncbi:MAG: hypothetical protein DI582_03330 [Azospirillum brasilense]|nr:MAG: hypothetical protein DI582_03330 [Azospirillum brasilense]
MPRITITPTPIEVPMRRLLLATSLLVASHAFAQVGATDTITVSETPFNAQSPVGDGVPMGSTVAAPVAAAPAAAQAAPALDMGLGKVFDEADLNKDGFVTREEFIAKAERHFGMADTNKDNRVSREELAAQQNSILRNVINTNNIGSKIQGFINGVQTAPAANIQAPVSPTVTSPAAPTAPVMQRSY